MKNAWNVVLWAPLITRGSPVQQRRADMWFWKKIWERINTKLDFGECPEAEAKPGQTSLGQRGEGGAGSWLSTLSSGRIYARGPDRPQPVCFLWTGNCLTTPKGRRARSHGCNYSMRNYKIKYLDATTNKHNLEEVWNVQKTFLLL